MLKSVLFLRKNNDMEIVIYKKQNGPANELEYILKNEGCSVTAKLFDETAELDSIKEIRPDVVIFDEVSPDVHFVSFIQTLRSESSLCPKIIAVSSSFLPDDSVDCFIEKPFSRSDILREVFGEPEISEDENTLDMEIIVTDMLHKLGIPAHISGYRYLREAIILAVYNPEILDSVTKVLYPSVAKRFGITPPRVERAIRHAVEVSWDRGLSPYLFALFGGTLRKKKPSNSEFIARVSDDIRLCYKNEIKKELDIRESCRLHAQKKRKERQKKKQ